jgi:hypothetical protein
MHASDVRKYISTLEQNLGDPIEGQRLLLHEGKSLSDAYASDFFDADSDDPSSPIRPFIGIPPSFLPAAVEGFKKHYAPWILSVLRDFKPYNQLLSYAREENLIEGQFSQFHAQPKSAQTELMKSLESEHGEDWKNILIFPHEKQILRIKGDDGLGLGDQWAFKTIFQKSILRIAKHISLFSEEDIKRKGKTEDFIGFLDDLYDRNILRVLCPIENESYKFWTFVTLNYGNEKINVSTASENRIENLLTIAYTGFRYAAHAKKSISKTASEDSLTPRKIFSEISTQASHPEWGAHDASRALLELMTKNATIIDLALGKKEQDGILSGEDLDKKKRQIGKDRLIALLTKCWLPDGSMPKASLKDDDDMI